MPLDPAGGSALRPQLGSCSALAMVPPQPLTTSAAYGPPLEKILSAPLDTRCYFNVRSKADMSQLNLPHGNEN